MTSPQPTQGPFGDLTDATSTPNVLDTEPVPVTVPPLGATAAQPGTTTAPATPEPPAPVADAATLDPDTDTDEDGDEDPREEPREDHDEEAESEAEAPETAEIPPEALDTLNGLAGLGSQLASPLLGAATALPAAALQGAGGLVPALTSAVLPQLASALDQLGTTAPPGAPRGRIGTSADALSGGLGSLAGQGQAGDAARASSQALARQVAALRDVEHELGDILGLSSARTEADRATIEGIIGDVETALTAAGVQGNTPEAQASVLAALRQALDQAGDVVSAAARDKLSDAQFVRDLISTYLTAAGERDALHAGGLGDSAARAAHKALGLPYVWGGGGALGPSGGGFDCSGLTQYAVAQGSGGRVMLPRTTYDQIKVGAQVPLGALSPGDLVFSNFSSPGVPEHVAIYIGGGQVIEAPQRGQPVQISGLPSGGIARRVM